MNQLDAKRREFLKKAGLGSMALVASQMLSPMLATPVMADDDDDDERMGFHYMCLSDGGVDSEGVHHQLIMAGTGKFDDEHVEGGGFFNHSDAASGIPNTLLGTGTWRAKRLISFTLLDHPNNPFGSVAAGILVAEVRLIPQSGPQFPATLTVICNVPPSAPSPVFRKGISWTLRAGFRSRRHHSRGHHSRLALRPSPSAPAATMTMMMRRMTTKSPERKCNARF